jgi:hypothetical protein
MDITPSPSAAAPRSPKRAAPKTPDCSSRQAGPDAPPAHSSHSAHQSRDASAQAAFAHRQRTDVQGSSAATSGQKRSASQAELDAPTPQAEDKVDTLSDLPVLAAEPQHPTPEELIAHMLTTDLPAPLLAPAKSFSRHPTPLFGREHRQLMEDLPRELSRRHRSVIRMFLVCLECQGKSFADFYVPTQGAAANKRPAALESEVNTAIAQGYVSVNTRHALNAGLTLELRGSVPHKIPIAQREHEDKLASLDFDSTTEKLYTRYFFSYLEKEGLLLSQLELSKRVSPDSTRLLTVGDALEQAVLYNALPQAKCNMVRKVLGLNPAKKKVERADHQALLQTLPGTSTLHHKGYIRRFFIALESAGLNYAQLRGPTTPGPQFTKRPQALEDHVNQGTAEKKYTENLRSVLNFVFGLELRGPSGEEQWPRL